MGRIHDLIAHEGIEQARFLAETKADRQAIDAAAAILTEEAIRLGITHAGFAMTSLPHKRVNDRIWERQGYLTTLMVESGIDRQRKPVGVPYGSMARVILLYLQTEAIRTGSPVVELGRSMNAWISRMGITQGGKTHALVSEQARRISACRLTFFTQHGATELRHNGAFVRNAISLSGLIDDSEQPSLWQDRVRLDEGFWQSLLTHPVPVREDAIFALGARSVAIDIYIWLAYRLHSLASAVTISWPAVHSQFGGGFKNLRQFKPKFAECLNLALAVYPEARVDIVDDGIILHPSPPAVRLAIAKRLGRP